MSLEERNVSRRRGELIKFLILVIFLFGTVLAVAVLSPFIFNLIVPSVLGWDQPAEQIEEPDPAGGAPPVIEVTVTTTPVPELTEPAPVEVIPTTTPLPPTATIQQYTVQPGDNLTEIANRFEVTVEALIQANQLANPNRLIPGDVLLIPEAP